MNILFYSPTNGDAGGMEAFVLNLSSYLQRNGYTVFVIFKIVNQKKISKKLETILNGNQVPYLILSRPDFSLVKYILSADIVHIQNTSIEGVVLSKLLRKKCILTIHNRLERSFHPRNLCWRLVHKLADRRWYNSEFVKCTWEPNANYLNSVNPPIVSNLPHGFVSFEKRRGFVFMSRWVENKGLDELIEAYNGADIDRSEWPLKLLGDGPLREKILDQVSRSEGIEVVGFVDEETKHAILKSSKWLVAPPKTKEDLGLTPIEARNVKVPCIITNDGGLPEAGGIFSLICEPGDVIGLRELLERAARMSEEEYQILCNKTKEELDTYLKPLSTYEDEYLKILNG